jgi:pimeloyl-ACP methyl ester carboxylesterase
MPILQLADDLTVHYLDINPDGPRTALLLHGLGVTGRSWQFQIPALAAAGYRVLAPDFRGFGQSSYPGQTSIAEMARDAAVLLQALAGGPADVVGISMGGTVALRLALDYPDIVSRLVLVNTAARLRPSYRAGWILYALRYAVLYALGPIGQARLVARRTFPHPHQETMRQFLFEQIVQSNQYAYRASLRALGRFDISPRLAEIAAPTLVVSGEHDSAIPLHIQRPLADGIAGARHVVIPETGHGVIAERPDEFNRVLLEFLEDAPAECGTSCC